MPSIRQLITKGSAALGLVVLSVVAVALGVTMVPLADAATLPATPNITAGPTGLVTSTTATFTYSNPASVNFGCSLDNATYAACPATASRTGTVTYSGLADGTHSFAVKATTGTTESAATTRNWSIDANRPTVTSINRLDPNPHAFGTVRWAVTFSEPVTNTTLANFSLSSTGLGSSPALISINGSAAAYTVTATSGPATPSGSATVRLNLSNVGSIRDLAGNTLAATFNGDTYTLDGESPVVTLGRVNGASVSFPFFTNIGVTSIGGSCGTAPGDSTGVTVTVTGPSNLATTAACTAGSWTRLTSFTGDGSYALLATQADSVGNQGTSSVRNIVIDRTAPVVDITKVNGVAATFPLNRNSNVSSLGGTCTNGSTDSPNVNVSVSGAAAVTTSTPCISGGWTLNVSLTVAGLYSATATQSDKVGNVGTSGPKNLTIDKVPPVVTISTVNGSATIEGSLLTFPVTTSHQVNSVGGACGTLPDDGPTVSVSVVAPPAKAGTQTGVAQCVAGSWSYALNPSLLANGANDGDFTITATQGDAAGNNGTTGGKVLTMATAKFTISGNAVTPLRPGTVTDLDLTIRNPYDFSIRVESLIVSVVNTNKNGCGPENFTVSRTYTPRRVTVPPGATLLARSTSPQIRMLNTSVIQDACKSASITLAYSGTASRP